MTSQDFEKIKAIMDEYLDRPLVDLPSEEELAQQQVLSARFLRRMERLVNQANRKQKSIARQASFADPKRKMTLKKRLVMTLIVCAILPTAVGVFAYRAVVSSFVIEVFEKFSSIRFVQKIEPTDASIETDPHDDITDHLPSLIPAGYTLSEELMTDNLVQLVYTDASATELIFLKAPKDGTQFGLDTENAETELLYVNGYQAYYYTKNGLASLIWADDYYAYSVIGKVTKESMISLAESTKVQ